ncbi:hypothetical protein HID58_070736 [Brassica napus]|uniref:Uncharacterized protein n=1 Tax=Brassica napus TaxID=3708 RepID=A0ABQ7YZL2_BRANA|nr:hypothetical protein HID58_070736 [Brassica napus]
MIRKTKDERKRVAERKIQSAVRFRQVIDLLSSEKKLIVGHNSILDINAPNLWLLFKFRMNKSSTSLSSAFSSLYPQVEVPSRGSDLFLQQRVKIDAQVDDVRCSNWNTGGKHEAGYDAFVTGCGFAQACSHLGTRKSELVADFLKLKEQLESDNGPVTIEICSSHILKLKTVGVKPRTRPETTERRENMVAVTDKASDLIDAVLAIRV